jgi:hypothetical protein
MPNQLRAVAFDLDAASLSGLREALPEWEIEVVNGATAASLTHDWNHGAADLLVVQAREAGTGTILFISRSPSEGDRVRAASVAAPPSTSVRPER